MGMSDERSSIQRGSRQGRISMTMIAVIVAAVVVAAGVAVYYLFIPRSGPEIVRIDGSSTVFPITSSWAVEFNTPSRQVTVAFSGTGGGFAKFCRGETDMNDASRPIRQSELNLCTTNGITGVTELLVAYDGLSIVVNKDNTWVQNLTVSQLCRIWTSNTSSQACGGAGRRVTMWNQLDPSWPAQPIGLYGPGTDSGTFDYFVEAILGNVRTAHTDQYQASEDDNQLVQGVASDLHASGYFGYAYAVRNTATIRIVPIDNEDGRGAIMPTHDTIRDGSYAPLSRPLFIYGSAASLSRQLVEDFLRFGYSTRGVQLVDATGYVSLIAAEIQAELAKLS